MASPTTDQMRKTWAARVAKKGLDSARRFPASAGDHDRRFESMDHSAPQAIGTGGRSDSVWRHVQGRGIEPCGDPTPPMTPPSTPIRRRPPRSPPPDGRQPCGDQQDRQRQQDDSPSTVRKMTAMNGGRTCSRRRRPRQRSPGTPIRPRIRRCTMPRPSHRPITRSGPSDRPGEEGERDRRIRGPRRSRRARRNAAVIASTKLN